MLLKARRRVMGGGSRILLYSSVFFLCALFISVPTRAETQRVEGLEFQRILIHGDVEVEVKQGDGTELVVRGSHEDLKRQPFFLKGGTLVLGRSADSSTSFGRLRYKVTAVVLEQLQLNGSGEVYVKPMRVEDLYVSVDGSGDVKLFQIEGRSLTVSLAGSGDIEAAVVRADDVRLLLSGSGDIRIGELTAESIETSVSGSGEVSVHDEGQASTVDINIAGSGDIDFEVVRASECEVNIMGSGTVKIDATETLDVNTMGSGEVYYYSSPEVSQSVLGSGEVTRRK
jgi:hypothetical protein